MIEPGWRKHLKWHVKWLWIALIFIVVVMQLEAQGRYYIEGKLQSQVDEINHRFLE